MAKYTTRVTGDGIIEKEFEFKGVTYKEKWINSNSTCTGDTIEQQIFNADIPDLPENIFNMICELSSYDEDELCEALQMLELYDKT